MTSNNNEFAFAEETITNRPDREGILLREGILFSAKEEVLEEHKNSVLPETLVPGSLVSWDWFMPPSVA